MGNLKNLLWIVMAGLAVASCGSKKGSESIMPEAAGLEHVEMRGELAERINRNFDRMESELYRPAAVYWSEEESGGWPADKEGRTMLALVMDARASGRTPVYLKELVGMLPSHLNERGYMGSVHDFVDEQQLSGHGWLLRALCEYYEWTGDKSVMETACGIADSLFLPIASVVEKYPISPDSRRRDVGDMSGSAQNVISGWRLSSDVGCVFIGMDGLIHYYSHNPKPELKALIDSLIDLFMKIDLIGIKAQTHATLTSLRGIIRYAKATGDYSLIPEVEKRWDLYRKYGMTENYENYNWFCRYDTWTEPCAIIDSYIVAMQLWQLTRRPEYLEDAERIYYNGICVTQRANGGFGCDKPVGHVYEDLSVHCDEAHWCCTMRGGEGLGRVAEYSYFVKGDTIFVPSYHDSRLTLDDIVIDQKSDYPFGNRVVLELSGGSDVALALGAPGYMNIECISVNGKSISPGTSNGFVTVEGLNDGDRVELNYSFKAEKREVQGNAEPKKYKMVYGPLVLGAEGDPTAPLYHLMSPEVSVDSGYSRKVVTE